MSKTKYELNEDGTIYRIVEDRYKLQLNQDVIKRIMGESVSIKIPGVANAGAICNGFTGNIGVSYRNGAMAATIPMDFLPLRTTFAPIGGMMVPDFTGVEGATKMFMKWFPVGGMRLFLVIALAPKPAGLMGAGDQYFVAMDKTGRMFRLPTTNAYENCRMCHGQYDGIGSSILDCCAKAWAQFESSEWQADLQDRGGENGMANSRLLFRFKPLETEGFHQVEPDKPWDTYCTKVNVEFLNNHIVL